MRFARAVLAISALTWAGFGVMIALNPAGLSGVGLEVDNPLGRVEVRGFYGGLELGLAAFLAWSLCAPERVRAGLMLAALTVGCTASGRLFGIALEGGQTSGLMWTFVALEASACVLSVWAYRRLLAGAATDPHTD